jgi:hypothetical protein
MAQFLNGAMAQWDCARAKKIEKQYFNELASIQI